MIRFLQTMGELLGKKTQGDEKSGTTIRITDANQGTNKEWGT